MTDLNISIPHVYDKDCPLLKTDEGCYSCCDKCNYDRHICGGCGEPLSHLGNGFTVTVYGNGKEYKYFPHPDCVG